jgi:hypothetical protein
MEAASNFGITAGADCAAMAGARIIPTMMGAASAAMPPTASAILRVKLNLTMAAPDRMDWTRGLRSDPGYAGDAGERGFDIQLANAEDGFRVVARMAALSDDCFMAGTLTLGHETRADPPDDWMEPEDGPGNHVDRGGEIAAPADAGKFMSENGAKLARRKPLLDSVGPEQDGMPDAADAGFQESWCGADVRGIRALEWGRGADGGSDAEPRTKPDRGDADESECPPGPEQEGEPSAGDRGGRWRIWERLGNLDVHELDGCGGNGHGGRRPMQAGAGGNQQREGHQKFEGRGGQSQCRCEPGCGEMRG